MADIFVFFLEIFLLLTVNMTIRTLFLTVESLHRVNNWTSVNQYITYRALTRTRAS